MQLRKRYVIVTILAGMPFLKSVEPFQKVEAAAQAALSITQDTVKLKEAVKKGLDGFALTPPKVLEDSQNETELNFGLRVKVKSDSIAAINSATQKFVLKYLRAGMPLSAIIRSSSDKITWVEWPEQVNEGILSNIRGIVDKDLSSTDWYSDPNELIIFFKSYSDASGLQVHLFQNSYRASNPNRFREASNPYVAIVKAGEDVYVGELPYQRLFSPRGVSSPGFVPHFLGFVPISVGETPGILIYHGPNSHALKFDIIYYLWNADSRSWDGAALWSQEGVVSYNYDANTTDFTFYTCNAPHPDGSGPNVPSCAETFDVKDYINQNHELLESQRKENVRRGSSLSVPRRQDFNEATIP